MVFMAKLLLNVTVIILIISIPVTGHTSDAATKTIQILSNNHKHEFIVEVADTLKKQEIGLSKRDYMAPNKGMLFLSGKTLSGKPRIIDMWMKDTYIPLDMIFIKPGGQIAKIATATPESLETITSGQPVVAVLELNAGICKKLDISVGDKVFLK